MSERFRLIGPEDEGQELEADSEVIVPAAEHPGQSRTVFSVTDSDFHDGLFELEEQIADDRFVKAKAYFRKSKKHTFELIPDHVKGEEGRRFRKITGALAAVASVGTYVIIRKKSKE